MLPLVIINPASAGSRTQNLWPAMASDLATHFGAFNCAFTEKPGDGRVLALRGAKEGRELIIACGGDGTISEVANGILESGCDAELGILPSGTGGDFRRTLSIPKRTAEASRALRNGRTLRIDVSRAAFLNQDGAEESRYFLGVASLGMSTEIIRRVKERDARKFPAATRAGWLGGKLSFAAATVQTTFAATRAEIVAQLDEGRERRLKVANLCVANARYFGGGMKIAPHAKLDDGQFDVVTIGDLKTSKILANTHKLYRGTHLDIEQVFHARAQIVKARASVDEVEIEIDGELVGRLPAEFEIIPRALRVRCPPGL